jgi:hypothetical protein
MGRTRRMTFRGVQRGEVIVFGLDVGAFGDTVSKPREDILDLPDRLGQQVQMPPGEGLSRKADVHLLRHKPLNQLIFFELLLAICQHLLQRRPYLVAQLADDRFLLV